MTTPAGDIATPSAGHLFRVFLRLGVGAFGGPAMVAFIRRNVVEQRRWLTDRDFREGVAVCQALPGATSMQLSAWVGLQMAGVTGAAAALIGFGLPAVGLMLALSTSYQQLAGTAIVTAVFGGLQAITVAIVASATVSFGRSSLRNWRHFVIAAGAAGALALKVHPILVVAASGVTAVALGPRQETADLQSSSTPRSTTRPLLGICAAVLVGFAILAATSPELFELGTLMTRIDLFAFGGGFTSLPLMFHEVISRGWMSTTTFLDGVALGQVTPGPVILTATFVGLVVAGYPGAAVATIAIFLPSFLILVGVAPHVSRLRAWRRFDALVAGLSASFVGLLATTTVRFATEVPWDPSRLVTTGVAFGVLVAGIDIVWVVLVGAAVSAVFIAP